LEREASGITLTLLLIGMLTLAFDIQPVKASGTIYIRADGSIDPPTAPIQREGDFYTLTGNITSDFDGIVIERDNMTLDGADYYVQGRGAEWSTGMNLTDRTNVTIRYVGIESFWCGVLLWESSNNRIYGNTIATNNLYGIALRASSNNMMYENMITENNLRGIKVAQDSNNNSIFKNTITNNSLGIQIGESASHNSIFGNSITNNKGGISIFLGSEFNSIFQNNVTNNTVQGIGLIQSVVKQ